MKMRYLKVIFSLTLLIALTGCNSETQTIGLTARGNSFDISNAEGETVSCRSGDFSGDMDLINQQIFEDAPESADRYLLETAFSDSFTYQCEGDGGQLFPGMTHSRTLPVPCRAKIWANMVLFACLPALQKRPQSVLTWRTARSIFRGSLPETWSFPMRERYPIHCLRLN